MKLEELPDDFTVNQFLALDRDALDQIPYELKKWQCQIKGCTNGTTVRDYGLEERWYHLHRNSKYAKSHPVELWLNLESQFWMCSKHYKFFHKMVDRFGRDHAYRRLVDTSRWPYEKLFPISDTNMKTVKQIE